MIASKVKAFFAGCEAIWAEVPGYAKVFLYSVTSAVFGLWMTGELSWSSVMVIVAINLGIYKAPRVANEAVKNL